MNDNDMQSEINPDIHRTASDLTAGIRQLEEFQSKITLAIRGFHENMQEVAKKATKAYDQMEQALHRIATIDFTHLSPVLMELSQYGWYVNYSFDFVDIANLKELLANLDEAEIDNFMSKLIETEIDSYIHSIGKEYPKRITAIEQAQKAHQAGLYFTSIPVIFAQIDGLSAELTGYKFFDNDRKTYEPLIAKWATNAGTFSIENAFLSVLLDKGAFQKHRNNPNLISFTRHSVLHGETTDYGSKVNSLKAFSLLMFLTDMFSKRGRSKTNNQFDNFGTM